MIVCRNNYTRYLSLIIFTMHNTRIDPYGTLCRDKLLRDIKRKA